LRRNPLLYKSKFIAGSNTLIKGGDGNDTLKFDGVFNTAKLDAGAGTNRTTFGNNVINAFIIYFSPSD